MELPTAEQIEETANKVPHTQESQILKCWVVNMKREINELRACREKLIAEHDRLRRQILHLEHQAEINRARMNISSL